jgi:hypothetical protein
MGEDIRGNLRKDVVSGWRTVRISGSNNDHPTYSVLVEEKGRKGDTRYDQESERLLLALV